MMPKSLLGKAQSTVLRVRGQRGKDQQLQPSIDQCLGSGEGSRAQKTLSYLRRRQKKRGG
jgi:hypothetical protein